MKMKVVWRCCGGFLLAVAAALLAPAPVQAVCTGIDSQQVAHVFDGWISNCPDANPVTAYVYKLGSQATANNEFASGPQLNQIQDIVCEANTQTNLIGQTCQLQAGDIGDGNVTVKIDWGVANPTIRGCPSAAQADGGDPIGVQIICNDGKSLYITVGYSGLFTGYPLEAAYTTGGGTPAAAAVGPAPIIQTYDGSQACVHLLDLDVADEPLRPGETKEDRGFLTDCDPAAFGFGLTCDGAIQRPHPNPGRGRLYKKDAPCGTTPDPRLSTGWTGAIAPDAAGNACIPAPKPAAPNCTHIGATQFVDGVETLAVSGSFQLQSQGAAADKFQIDSAKFDKNRVVISFSTEGESELVGFNLFAGNVQLNEQMIAAQGGNRTYPFETARASLKGNKSVVLEGVFTDGTKRRSPAFQLK